MMFERIMMQHVRCLLEFEIFNEPKLLPRLGQLLQVIYVIFEFTPREDSLSMAEVVYLNSETTNL